jgi:hypothetical protein
MEQNYIKEAGVRMLILKTAQKDSFFVYLATMNKRHIITLLFTVLLISCCQSQNKNIPAKKIETKFDSLYPHAINIIWYAKDAPGSVQGVGFDCNCPEGTGHLVLTFDTNGNIESKNVFISEKDLPGNIVAYIESNYSSGFKYGDIVTLIENNKEMGYKVNLLQVNPDGDPVSGGWTYILKFKATGEFISLDKR